MTIKHHEGCHLFNLTCCMFCLAVGKGHGDHVVKNKLIVCMHMAHLVR